MPDPIYEVIAQGARYWFLFLMALIAWRSWRWYRKDKRQAKKRLKLLPDAGYVGEMVIIRSEGSLPRGAVLAVPREGTLGELRTNDLCLPGAGVAKRHLWFRFEDGQGLLVEPFGKNAATVDGEQAVRRGETLCMAHGSWLTVGAYTLRLRLFAGFESTARAARDPGVEAGPEPQAQPAASDANGFAAVQEAASLERQMPYAQQVPAAQAPPPAAWGPPPIQAYAVPDAWPLPDQDELPEDLLPYDVARIAQEEGLADYSVFMRPKAESESPASEPEPWTELPNPDGGVQLYDEGAPDAAAPPKSAYVGHDEAERAKKRVWDKYFGGRV